MNRMAHAKGERRDESKILGVNRIGLEIIFEGKRLSYFTLPLPPPTCSELGEPIKGGEIPVI